MAKDDDILTDAKEAFREASDAERENRERALEDLRFARLREQWPSEIAKQRQLEGRPMLTLPRLETFGRQVVNDARQNKPAIKVHPVDSGADPETAEIFNGIIRNIEYNSGADIAYDTAIEGAVYGGFGYWRIDIDYAHDDTFDLDLKIQPVYDPFSVYGDPWATSADGSDWNSAFIVERMAKAQFKRQYPDADQLSWDSDNPDPNWVSEDWIQVAEWWQREEVKREIIKLSNGAVIDVAQLKDEEFRIQLDTAGIQPDGQTRTVATFKVKQCVLTAGEVLDKKDWPGRYIPIVPVYGDTVNIEGKRYFFSLIHPAKDAQRQFNFQRTAAVEMIALAPRVPFIGQTRAFTAAPDKWATINTQSHAFVEYEGDQAPQRQQLDATAIGPIQLAAQAQDDMKGVMGMFDASLGAQSNETSGRAIMARQREGDTSTFHFIDNLTRAIRHSGRILIDLIPHVWSDERIVRLIGEDGTATMQKVNAPVPVMGQDGQPQMEQVPGAPPGAPPQPVTRIFSLTGGKYDLTATAGPSYTTKRQESADQMIELLRAFPQAAPVIGDLVAKNLDWPGADEIADRLKAMLPPQIQGQEGGGGVPPQLKQMIEEDQKAIQQLTQENQQLKSDQQAKQASVMIDAKRLRLDEYKAETDRLKVLADAKIDAANLAASFAQPMSIVEPEQPQPQQQPMPGQMPRPNGAM